MAAIGETTANALLNTLFRLAAFTPDAAIYMGLSQSDPLENGSGLAEPSGGSYARVSVAAKFGVNASGMAIANSVLIAFPEATGDWGTVTHWFIANHLTNGGTAIRWRGPLQTGQTIVSGNTVSFAVGLLTATLE